MQTYRLTPIALALFSFFHASAQSATNLPPFKVDPALLEPARPSPRKSSESISAGKTLNKTPSPAVIPADKPAASSIPISTAEPAIPGNDSWQNAEAPILSATDDPKKAPTIIHADRMQGHQDKEIEAFGKVELRKPGQVLFADHLIYTQPENDLFAEGNVRIEQKGNITTGPELRLNLDTNKGVMDKPLYELAETHARGSADKLLFEGEDKYRAQDATYTTCPVGQDDWFLHAGAIDIDRTTQIGVAHHAYIEFKGVPLLYTPWISFSLNHQRKSGLLTPSFGTTGNSGAEFTLPYYWNIAPNYDATITPRALSKRGLQIGTEFRYLQPQYSGIAQVELLQNDRVTNSNRYALNLQHQQNLGSGWSGSLNLQKVSDDNYFRDLSTRLTSTTQTNLPREGVLNYSGGWWTFGALMQRFQTLQDPLAPVVPPYHRIPQLTLNAAQQNVYGTDIALTSEFVNFNNPAPSADKPDGKRLTVYPSVSLPLTNIYGYITPKIGVHHTRYTLDKNQTSFPDTTRTLPIISVDSGIAFERDAEILGDHYLQTLEPRLYYLNIPYRDQSLIPNFDTAEADFNFAQIFSENQFTGGDRINDANQVTAAITTRVLQPENGLERVRAAIGQRYYFKDQQVTLSSPARTNKTSDILVALGGQITPAWSMDAGWQYNPNLRKTLKSNLSARYLPGPHKIVNMSYRFTRDSLRQIDLSAQWPITEKISGLARWNYSILDSKVLEGLAGVEYNGGCWAVRAVVHSLATATAQTTNSFFLQLELNGVSSLGANPLEVLRQSIAGYSKTNE